MISTKKLIKMVRKWQRIAAIGRKRISLPKTNQNTFSATEVEKGHFVVYTVDGKRLVFPIAYLNTFIFRGLLIMSEEEFGLPSDGPITFPCDASFMEYVTKLIQHGATEEMEKALMMSLSNRCSYSYNIDQRETSQHVLACC